MGALALAGLLVLNGCGSEANNKKATEYINGTATPVNYNDPSTVDQPTGVHPYASSANKIPKEDLAAKSGSATEQTPAQIATSDNNDTYSDNTSGLITAGTLDSWMNNWSGNKPSGISGDLVILEVMDGGSYDSSTGDWKSGGIFFSDANSGVRTYVVGNGEVSETRNNGVMDTPAMVLSESSMNDLMTKYDVDPANDMVVVAMGKGGGFANMVMGRIWYALRYWGAPADHLAILNGGAQYHADQGTLTNTTTDPTSNLSGHYKADGSNNLPVPPKVALSSITAAADLPEANMQLMISYQGMLKAAKDQLSSNFIWDVRRADEFYGWKNEGRGYAFEGHIRGAHWLPYSDLLVPDEGWRYLDKAHLKSAMSDLGYKSGQTVITHCVTTYRAMVSGIAAGVVLGYPTRLYDGAWMQWAKMAYHQNKQGTYNLPSDSPWRSDIAKA
ncbi:MAG TPA: rhodanese-like domain-containing protein, partial [Gammaproteobacteria bacterium]|nr:rhodanese-like domain-containing protein [Gammaproteobacteria bacterium]